MIHRLLLLCGIFIVNNSITSWASSSHRYLVPEKHRNLLPAGFDFKKAQKKGDFLQVELSLDSVESLASALHKNGFGCGGFFEITGEDTKTFFNRKWTTPFKPRKIQNLQESRSAVALTSKKIYKEILEGIVSFSDRSARTEHGRKAMQWFVAEARRYAQFHQRSEDVKIKTIATGTRYTQDSVVVELKGQNSSLPGVLIGAHMDTFARNKPGADDDGSGSAGVMEIFRAILASKMKFKRDLYFVFYAAEELGLVGSRKVVEEFVSQERTLEGVMQLDMIGYRSPENDKAMYFVQDNVSPELTKFTKELAVNVIGLKENDLGQIDCGYACSDHASWHRKGYPAVLPFEATMGTYNSSIHTGHDNISKLNFDHAMNFVRLGLAFMVELGQPLK